MNDEMLRIRITLPKRLVDEVDQLVGRAGRNAYIVAAIEDAIKHIKSHEADEPNPMLHSEEPRPKRPAAAK